jgi:hypothetical protein
MGWKEEVVIFIEISLVARAGTGENHENSRPELLINTMARSVKKKQVTVDKCLPTLIRIVDKSIQPRIVTTDIPRLAMNSTGWNNSAVNPVSRTGQSLTHSVSKNTLTTTNFVTTPLPMRTAVFWGSKRAKRFEETYRLHLTGRKVSQATNKQNANRKVP